MGDIKDSCIQAQDFVQTLLNTTPKQQVLTRLELTISKWSLDKLVKLSDKKFNLIKNQRGRNR